MSVLDVGRAWATNPDHVSKDKGMSEQNEI